MFSFNQKVEQSILWASLIALLLGIIGIVAVSDFFTRPITKLAQKVRKIKPQSDFKLDRLGIYEIDELINSIEDLNKRAMENQNKLSTVVHMTGLPIGAFEIDRRTNEEEFTRDFNEVFIEKLKLNETVENFTKASFREKLESFEEYLFLKEEESASVYRLPYIDEEWRYIRLRRVISDEKILGLMVDVTEEFEEKQKIEYERDHDLLTSLYNRRAFYSEIEKVFENPASIGVGAMVMMDIDNLKFINDTYGHDYGDAYIKAAAEVLKVFKGDKTLITRMSGDEFLVFIYGTLSKKAVKEKIEAIKEAFVGAYMSLPENENFKIRISGGVAWYPYDSEMYGDLVKFADFAMYQVKKSTKGDFRDFDAETYDRDGYLLQGRGRLNKLIDDDLVDYNFQAIVDINKAEIFAYEALMRPNDGYMRTPQEVITLARNEGKLYQIEKLTWRKSLERFEEGLDKVSDTCKVFVNTIPNQMLTEADYDELYERFGSMFSRVVLEVTEEDKLDEHALHRWEKIRTLGIETAIDDYGSGYNAQTLLIELSPNYVKIDMELVRNIDKDENRQVTVNSLLQYTKPRGIRTIAEGVETIEELKYMFSAGVDFVQGYLLQKPSNEPSELEENTKELLRNISI